MRRLDREDLEKVRNNLNEHWQETQKLANENDIGHFLDNPLELNRLILKLMELERRLQRSAQRFKHNEGNPEELAVNGHFRKYACGKFDVDFMAEKGYGEKAEKACRNAMDIYAVLNHDKFIDCMKSMGVPDDVILKCLSTCFVDDECYAADKPW